MDGKPYMAARFAATLRRSLYRGKFEFHDSFLGAFQFTIHLPEHLGLIPPQLCESRNEEVTKQMQPAPIPNDYELGTEEDQLVADPLADSTLELFDSTAKKNRAIFTEVFRPVPSNLVRDYKSYEVRFAVLSSELVLYTLGTYEILNFFTHAELRPEG